MVRAARQWAHLTRTTSLGRAQWARRCFGGVLPAFDTFGVLALGQHTIPLFPGPPPPLLPAALRGVCAAAAAAATASQPPVGVLDSRGGRARGRGGVRL